MTEQHAQDLITLQTSVGGKHQVDFNPHSSVMPDSRAEPVGTRIVQVAISSLNGARSRRWYERGLGYLPAGNRHPTADLSAVQGIDNARVANVLWLVDRQDFFQLEIFEYASPKVRPQPADRQASDIGYARIGVWVADLDQTLGALAELGTAPMSAPTGSAGARRVCVPDPDGVAVELMEQDEPPPGATEPAHPHARALTRSVTVSVPDLDRSLRYFAKALGMAPVANFALHTDADEALWGLRGAHAERVLLAAGNIWLELVQYQDPAGRPRPADYRISDQGILNIAVGRRTLDGFTQTRDAVVAAGYTVHAEVAQEQLRIQYAEDLDGFSVEIGYFDEALDAIQGFRPLAPAWSTGMSNDRQS